MPVSLACSNCSAPLHATGRTQRVRCAFCDTDNLLDAGLCAELMKHAPVAPPPVADRLRPLLALAQQDAARFLEDLARRLEVALPGRVQVERKGGLFSSPHAVSVTVDLQDFRYALELHHHGVEGKRCHAVRGIVLKSEALSVAEALSALGAELFEQGVENPAGKPLEKFLAA